MKILIYASKKNFALQKAERFFKERKIPYQLLDLKKHRLGGREIDLFAQKIGMLNLVDRKDKRAIEHPISHTNIEQVVKQELLENPLFLISPIVRKGNEITVGEDMKTWEKWVKDRNF